MPVPGQLTFYSHSRSGFWLGRSACVRGAGGQSRSAKGRMEANLRFSTYIAIHGMSGPSRGSRLSRADPRVSLSMQVPEIIKKVWLQAKSVGSGERCLVLEGANARRWMVAFLLPEHREWLQSRPSGTRRDATRHHDVGSGAPFHRRACSPP